MATETFEVRKGEYLIVAPENIAYCERGGYMLSEGKEVYSGEPGIISVKVGDRFTPKIDAPSGKIMEYRVELSGKVVISGEPYGYFVANKGGEATAEGRVPESEIK